MKKKIFAFCMTAFLLFSFTVNTFATTVTLPDGGSTKNTGVDKVLGRTSGGRDGYANMTCTIVAHQGVGAYMYDYAVSTVESDVPGIKSGYTEMIIYYASTSGEEKRTNGAKPTNNTLPFSLSVNSISRYATKAVAGHSITYETRGTWACGTAIEFK